MVTPTDKSLDDVLMNDCLAGRKLYGDDFSVDEIVEWFADEEEGFANLGAKNRENYCYEYHGLNRLHGFNHLPSRPITMRSALAVLTEKS